MINWVVSISNFFFAKTFFSYSLRNHNIIKFSKTFQVFETYFKNHTSRIKMEKLTESV